jgi:hypothetical protein
MDGTASLSTALGQGLQLRPYTAMMAVDAEPAEWPLDELGAPRWIVGVHFAHLCEWVPLVPSAGSEPLTRRWRTPWPAGADSLPAGAMPTLAGVVEEPEKERRRPGNPGVIETAPTEARAAAWLRDLRAHSFPRIYRELLAPGSNRGDERAAARGAQRYVDAGRLLLSRERVLPWFLFPKGRVEDGWWNSSRFRAALDLWHFHGLRSGSFASQREHARIVAGRLALLEMFERGFEAPLILRGTSHPRSPDDAALRLGRAAAMLGHPTLHSPSVK